MMYDTLALLQASEKRCKTQLGHIRAVPLPEVGDAAASGLPSEQVITIHIDCSCKLTAVPCDQWRHHLFNSVWWG